LAEAVAGDAPAGGGGVDGWGVGEGLEDEVAGVAAAGGSYFPVVGCEATLEVGGLEAEVGGVEDGFEGAEFVEDGGEGGVGGEEGFAGRHGFDCRAMDTANGSGGRGGAAAGDVGERFADGGFQQPGMGVDCCA